MSKLMKKLIILVGFIIVTGCGHTHPVAEHQHLHGHDHHHSHQHDHPHESEAVTLRKELVGKFQLEEYNDETGSRNNFIGKEERGELTIALDYKLTFFFATEVGTYIYPPQIFDSAKKVISLAFYQTNQCLSYGNQVWTGSYITITTLG